MDPMSLSTEMQAPQAARRRTIPSIDGRLFANRWQHNSKANGISCHLPPDFTGRATYGDNLNGWHNLHDGGCQHLGKSINGCLCRSHPTEEMLYISQGGGNHGNGNSVSPQLRPAIDRFFMECGRVTCPNETSCTV